ncbi:MAG: hypothetical protein ACN6P8_01390 [Achromobacter piechaudii]
MVQRLKEKKEKKKAKQANLNRLAFLFLSALALAELAFCAGFRRVAIYLPMTMGFY